MIGKGVGLSAGLIRHSPWVPPGYRLTFSDEFNSTLSFAANTSAKWQSQFPWGGRTPGTTEVCYYSDPTDNGVNPFSTVNSVLRITADLAGTNYANGRAYTSGILTTYPSFSQLYGYFEARCKLPQGKSFWPAFWLSPQDQSWPPEIDIFECFGADNGNNEGGPDQVHCGVWAISTGGGGGWNTVNTINGNIYNAFHTYSCLWTNGLCKFYFDGMLIATQTCDNTTKPMYVLLDLDMGYWPGQPDATTIVPAQFQIDYVRVYTTP